MVGPLGDAAKALRTGGKVADATSTLNKVDNVGDAGSVINKVAPRPGTLDDLSGAAQAAASRAGNVCKSKVCEYGIEIAPHPDDAALVKRIAENGDKGGNGLKAGDLTEQLAENIAKRSGYESLGAKYGSNNGFDHVLIKKMDDGSVMILDSKQMDNFTTTLGKGAGGEVQLSNGWIDAVIDNLEKAGKGSEAIAAIKAARLDGKLTTAVIAVDKATKKIIAIPVKVGS